MDMAKQKELSGYRQNLAEAQLRLSKYHPERLWQSYQQRFDLASLGLESAARQVQKKRQALDLAAQHNLLSLQNRLDLKLSQANDMCANASRQLQEKMIYTIDGYRSRLTRSSELLAQLSPRKIQSKGWIMARKDGRIISSVKQLKAKDSLQLSFADGSAQTTVESTSEAL